MAEQGLRVTEVRKRIDAGKNTTYSLIASGAIRSVRLGTGRNAPIRVPESAVEDFLAGRTSLVASAGGADEN